MLLSTCEDYSGGLGLIGRQGVVVSSLREVRLGLIGCDLRLEWSAGVRVFVGVLRGVVDAPQAGPLNVEVGD
jgi:hypothetical protein